MGSLRHTELEAFLAVARAKSFRRAADERGVTGSALSQSVRKLEEEMQVRLFNRTTRSLALTEAGEILLARLGAAYDDVEAALNEVRSMQGRPAGRVRLNAPAPALEFLIAPYMPAFLKVYPEIELELIADASIVDIVAEGFDAGVRFGQEMADDMIAFPLGPPLDYAVVASPAYLEAHGAPERPHDLAAHDCIRHRFPGGSIFRWRFRRGEEEVSMIPAGRLTINDSRHALRAAVEGLGLARVPALYAASALEEGRLVRVLADWSPTLPAWHIYYPSRRQAPPALRAFLDFFRAAAANGEAPSAGAVERQGDG